MHMSYLIAWSPRDYKNRNATQHYYIVCYLSQDTDLKLSWSPLNMANHFMETYFDKADDDLYNDLSSANGFSDLTNGVCSSMGHDRMYLLMS
jgi:hypothetical protein